MIVLALTLRFSVLRIAPPPTEPRISPPVSVSPLIDTSIGLPKKFPSSMFSTRLPFPSFTPGVGSLPLASIESNVAPGP